MKLFRAASAGVVPAAGAFRDGIRFQLALSYGPPGEIAQNKMLLNSFVSGVTFRRNRSKLGFGAVTGRWQTGECG